MRKGARWLVLTILLGALVGLGSWIGADDEPEWVEAMRRVQVMLTLQ